MKIMIAAAIAGMLITTTTLATVTTDGIITLTPEPGYRGKLQGYEVCSFSYSPGTVLAPGTRLIASVPSEHYGAGSVVMAGDGLQCGSCMVPKITMDSTGVMRIYCEHNN